MKLFVSMKSRFLDNLSYKEEPARVNSQARSALTSVESVEKLWGSDSLRGIRSPGTALPYVVLLGTLRGKGYKDFVAMKGRGQGCILTFASGPFERWIFTIRQPESELAGLLSPA